MGNHDNSLVGFTRTRPVKRKPPGQWWCGFVREGHVQDAAGIGVEFAGEVTEGCPLLNRPTKGCEEMRVEIRRCAWVRRVAIDHGRHRPPPNTASLSISCAVVGVQRSSITTQRRRAREREHCLAITRVTGGTEGVRRSSESSGRQESASVISSTASRACLSTRNTRIQHLNAPTVRARIQHPEPYVTIYALDPVSVCATIVSMEAFPRRRLLVNLRIRNGG